MSAPLYILMRSDMASLNPGRAMAQAAHAANQFIFEAQFNVDQNLQNKVREWQEETPYGFGTTIVLDAHSDELIYKTLTWLSPKDYFAREVVDPEYVIKDGEVAVTLRDVLTCAFVFPISGDVRELKKFALYP